MNRFTVRVVALILFIIAGWCVYAFWIRQTPNKSGNGRVEPGKPKSFPLPPLAKSPFLNVKHTATYVGARKCAECHKPEYLSYLRTTHSRSLSLVDVSSEPPAGKFVHAASGRTYRIEHKNNQLWHTESIQVGGEEVVLSEFPMRYLFGSGAHTRSYVTETDGFLVESPITWYAAGSKWWISPGFDKPNHLAFERTASYRCVLCHAGRVEVIDGSLNRLQIHARTIDCERCHGPGSLHAQRQADLLSDQKPLFGPDMTIVHPARLSRDGKEAICGQCHIGNEAAIDVRGRSIGDFRPGLALTDFRIDYDFKSPKQTMTVVGHFRQMRQSRCYQKSDTLTCTTCHHPHRKPSPSTRIVYYRNKCLSCHRAPDATCSLPEKTRLQRNAKDSCIACHMPETPTDVPHTAFTHHRIGVHKKSASKKSNAPQELGTLTPLGDISRLAQIDRDRCLGLAYLQLAGSHSHRAYAHIYQQRGEELLQKVYQQGLRDAEIDAALANIYWRVKPQTAIKFAQLALGKKSLFPGPRLDALFVLGTTYFDLKNTKRAQQYLEKLVRCRRDAEDWALLSVCRLKANDLPGALKAANRAVQINPSRSDLHSLLAGIYRRIGDMKNESRHRQLSAQLEKWVKDKGAVSSPSDGPRVR